MKKALVLGGTGYLGAQVVEILWKKGYKIKVLTRQINVKSKRQGLEVVYGDMTHEKNLRRIANDCEYIIHLAHKVSFEEKDNIEVFNSSYATRNLIDNCKFVALRRFVYVSSAIVLSKSQCPYAVSKRMSEKIVSESKLPWVIVRPSNAKVSEYAELPKKNNVFLCPMAGNNIIDVDDAAHGIVAAMEKGIVGKTYNISGYNVRYKDIYFKLGEAMNKLCFIIEIPKFFSGLVKFALRKKVSPHLIEQAFVDKYCDNAEALKDLAWKPEHTLNETIGRGLVLYEQLRSGEQKLLRPGS